MKNKKLLILLLVFVLILGGAGFLYTRLNSQSNNISADQQGTQGPVAAPAFTLIDSSGSTVSLEDLRGKPIVINFWATWCNFCVREMPHFEAAYDQYGEDVHFLMVNVQESPETANAFLDKNGYSFPVYYDKTGRVYSTFGLSGLPATFFIDAEGNAIAQAKGAINQEMLQRGIDMVLPQN